MAEYIKREAAINVLCDVCPAKEFCQDKNKCEDYDRFVSIPAADVRPVVLCKDCKCYQQSSFVDNHMECARSGFPVHSVDFCSRGEKREES